jgi:prolyl oligopeptidase
MGWTRDEAIEYFKSNSPKSELDIVNEIDRYIGWPGQALGYKIGQLKILELRERAEAQLGDKFDIREFHDQLLSTGAVPLSVMETELNAWIEEKLIEGV